LGLRGKVDGRIDVGVEDGPPYKTRGLIRLIRLRFVLKAKIGH
jgi:hypothetical protein